MKPIDQWTVVELHEELQSRGVSVGGLKADLYERLRWELEATDQVSEAAASLPVNGTGRHCTKSGNSPQQLAGNQSRAQGDCRGALNSISSCGNSRGSSSDIVEEENARRGEADIQVGERSAGYKHQVDTRENSDVDAWEGDNRGGNEEEDGEPDFKFRLDEEEEEDMSDNAQDMLLAEPSPSSQGVGDEPDLVEEDEGDDLLVNEDLEPHHVAADVPQLRSTDGSHCQREQSVRRKDASVLASVQRTAECMEINIPRKWLPMPLIRVRNISEDSDLEALKEVMCEGCDGMEICSIHIDHSLDAGPSSALIRIVLPQLPWLSKGRSSIETTTTRADDGCQDHLLNRVKCEPDKDVSHAEDAHAGLLTKPCPDTAANAEFGSILEAAGEVGDVKKVAEFCVRKLKAAGVKLGESSLEFEAPILRTTLFVHNLRDEYKNDDASFKSKLEQHGELVRCFCVRNKDGASKDYGFVEFAVPSSAAEAKVAIDSKSSEALQRFRDAKMNAMQGDHGNILPEKRLRCEWSFNQTIPSLFSKICYVSNLPVGFMDREALRAVFESFGEIVSCNIRSRTGMGPGCGFVEFAHGRDAENAMLAMNGTHAERLGYILVSLVNPAKFPGDTAGPAFQRVGPFSKRARSDFPPARERGFARPFMMDPRGRSMLRDRGRGRGGPMQPQYAYSGYQMYGGYQSQGYQPGYHGNGYSFGHQHGGGYGNNFYPSQGNYPDQYHASDRSPSHSMGYKNPQFPHEGWGPMDGGKSDRGPHPREYGHGGDHGYGHQSGYSQGYSSYQSGGYGSGYGSPGYGPSGYGPGHQSNSHGHYSSGNSSYQSGYGGYNHHHGGGGYHGQPGYGGQSGSFHSYGNQEYGSGYSQSGFDHNGYGGDRRGSDYGLGDFVGEMGRDHKRPRY